MPALPAMKLEQKVEYPLGRHLREGGDRSRSRFKLVLTCTDVFTGTRMYGLLANSLLFPIDRLNADNSHSSQRIRHPLFQLEKMGVLFYVKIPPGRYKRFGQP